ncbi:MAG: alpha/beta hydrolase [Novosphingobium sp.]|nr:alpha/beta hydrolase [Novosphingobium sp.]
MKKVFALAALLTCGFGAAAAQDKPAAAAQTIEPDGTVHVPAYTLPPSEYLSAEAKAALPRTPAEMGGSFEGLVKSGRVPQIRSAMPPALEKEIENLLAEYDVWTEPVTVAGVRGIWVRPNKPQKGKPRILINLSAGAFLFASASKNGMQESIPLAGLGKFEILSLDYSQAPETTFPAASIDVEKVYRELLKTHRPSEIGLFGNSAGGQLVGQAIAWFQRQNLPVPAAAGLFCATADARWGGDAWHWHKPVGGSHEPPFLFEKFYYGSHDLDDPLISPIRSDAVLAAFPPTLLLTSTRAGEMSATVDAHRRLVRNRVDADLVVWDGLGHCFFTDRSLPETREAQEIMVRFFTRHVGQRSKQ